MVVVAIGAVVASLLVAVGAFSVYAKIDKEDGFYLKGAELADPDLLASLERSPDRDEPYRDRFGFQVHRLREGDGTVFGHRRYSNGDLLRIDDETYLKLTVWIRSGALPSEIDLEGGEDVIVVLSRGASAWPRNDCSGHVSSGFVRLEPERGGYRVTVDGAMTPLGNPGYVPECAAAPVRLAFRAEETAIGRLSPWLGAAADHPYRETYR